MSRSLVQNGPLEAKNDSTLIFVVCQYAIHVHYTNGSQGGFNTSHLKIYWDLKLLLLCPGLE